MFFRFLTTGPVSPWLLILFSLYSTSFYLFLLDRSSSLLIQALCSPLFPQYSRAFIWSAPGLFTAPSSGLFDQSMQILSAPCTPDQSFSSCCLWLFYLLWSIEVGQPAKGINCLDSFSELNIASANIIFAFGQNSSIMEPHVNSGRTAGCNLGNSGWIFIGVAKGTSLAQRLPCIKFQNMP